MKITLAQPKLLKDSVSVIADLVTEVRFATTKDALELIAMDPANVAMVIFKLLSSCFVEYDVKYGSGFAVNLNDFKQVLRRIKPDDSLTIEEEENKLLLTAKSSKGGSVRKFALPLIDLDDHEQKIPNLEFKAVVEMPSSRLSEAIEDVDIVGESVSFTVDKKKFTVSASGDLRKADVEISASEDTKIEAKDQVKSKFSIEYLKKMIQGSKLAGRATIKLSQDYPIKLEFTSVDQLHLAFILAPRVDND